jgi:hypothetical protein
MQDLIAKGADYFEAKRRQHMAVMVAYRRKGTMFDKNVPATIGSTRWDSQDASGTIARTETRDFFVAAADISEAPVRGDRIRETIDGVQRVYEVFVPGAANNPWSWADRQQRTRRIHTQLVESD